MDKPGEYGPPWGVGPEFTASGGPQETYGSGDRAFSPISAPARPPLAPLVHPPESHSLEISRVKHLTLHTCGPPPQRGGSPFVSDRAAAEADATAGIPCGGGPARGKARRRVPPRVWSWILATFCGLRKGRKAAGVAGGGRELGKRATPTPWRRWRGRWWRPGRASWRRTSPPAPWAAASPPPASPTPPCVARPRAVSPPPLALPGFGAPPPGLVVLRPGLRALSPRPTDRRSPRDSALPASRRSAAPHRPSPTVALVRAGGGGKEG